MSEQFEHIDDLIAKVTAGEASSEELTFVNNWKQLSAENAAYYEDAVKLFATIDGFKNESTVDVDAAWKKMENCISPDETKVVSLARPTILLRAVAAIAFIIVAGFLIRSLFTQDSQEPIVYSASTTTQEQKLPDGSSVFMNKNTQISFVINQDNVREVKLKGEAFFEVVHNEEQPFVIAVDELFIKDIGTGFNVKANPGSPVVEVFVETGEVQLYIDGNEGLFVVAGEKASYDKTTHSFSKEKSSTSLENTMTYRSKIFHFNKTTLREVVEQLNSVYDTNIKLSNKKLGDCRLSVVFENEDPEIILDIIAETLDLEIERSGGAILLKGESCSE